MNTGRSLLLPVSNKAVLNKAKLPQDKRYYSSDSSNYPPVNVILEAVKRPGSSIIFDLEDKSLFNYLMCNGMC